MPVRRVFGVGSFGEVGGGPELVQPSQLPSGLWMVRPAGPDLVGEVVGVLGAEHGFDPVEQFAELLLAVCSSILSQNHPDDDASSSSLRRARICSTWRRSSVMPSRTTACSSLRAGERVHLAG